MAGYTSEDQIRYQEWSVLHLRYNTGSLWPTLGLPAHTVINSGDAQYRTFWVDERTTSAQLPGWRVVKARGGNVTTDMVASRQKLSSSAGLYQDRWKTNEGQPTEFSYVYTESGNLFTHECERSGYISYDAAQNQAATQWINKARAVQTKLQAGVIAGELGQTLRGVLRNAKQLRRGLDEWINLLKRAKHKRQAGSSTVTMRHVSPREMKEWLAEAWLTWKFGYEQTIRDLDASMDLLATDRSLLSNYEVVEGKGQDIGSGFKSMPDGSYWKFDLHIQDKWDVTFRGAVDRVSPGIGARPASLAAGLDPSNWLPTVWELIPYSFLADYFVNVGDVISGMCFNSSTLKWASLTRRHEIESRVVNCVAKVGPGGGTDGIIIPGERTWQYIHVTRSRDVGVPNINFTFRIPGLSSTKWVNMAALAASSRALTPYTW